MGLFSFVWRQIALLSKWRPDLYGRDMMVICRGGAEWAWECSDFPRNSDFFLSKFMVNEIDANPLRSQNALLGGGGGVTLGCIHQNLLANWLDPATPTLFNGSRAPKSFWHKDICTRFTGNWFIHTGMRVFRLSSNFLTDKTPSPPPPPPSVTGLVFGTWIFSAFLVSGHSHALV